MKILVCGGRDFLGFEVLCDAMYHYRPDTVIQGGAKGADFLAKVWCHERRVKCVQVDAEWKKFGKAAGHIRNSEMLKLKPDLVLAFPGGAGTANMIKQAKAAKIRVEEIT